MDNCNVFADSVPKPCIATLLPSCCHVICSSTAAVGHWNHVVSSSVYLPVGHIQTLLSLRSCVLTDVKIRLCRVYCMI